MVAYSLKTVAEDREDAWSLDRAAFVVAAALYLFSGITVAS